MMNVFIYSITLLMMMIIIIMLMYMISYKSMMDHESMSPFECEFDPFESSRIPFSSHFFMVAVIFLIFDVELVSYYYTNNYYYSNIKYNLFMYHYNFLFNYFIDRIMSWMM